MTEIDLEKIAPDNIFEGGDLDCGSGLILLIRENMLATPDDGILEMRSVEPTVADDLPPWCRMVGHEYLGNIETQKYTRYFVRKGAGNKEEEKALTKDKDEAKGYEWRLRVRSTGHLKSTVYSRNFSFEVGQVVSFEEKDVHPSGLEYFFGALAASLTTSFSSACTKENLEVDDIEISLTGTLNNTLAHMGLEDGDPSIKDILVKCFASTFEDEDKVKAIWEQTNTRDPLVATLTKATNLQTKLVIV